MPRSLLWPLAAVGLIAAAVLAFLLLHHGPPKLEQGSFATAGRRLVPLDPATQGSLIDLRYREGRDATFQLSVRNAGDDSVRLVGAEILGANAMFARRRVRFGSTPSEPDSVEPGASVVLDPGKEALVTYTGRFTHCGSYGPGSTAFSDRLTVLYGDHAKRVEVPLSVTVRVKAPRDCPE